MASRDADVAFGVLGPLQVSRDGGELEFGSPQIRLVLAALKSTRTWWCRPID
jgi:DNA-binding SARP family transcriptional activator